MTSRKVPFETGAARYGEIARGRILGDDSGLLKMLFHREDHRLLGVHTIGTSATELIHIGQAVLGLGVGLDAPDPAGSAAAGTDMPGGPAWQDFYGALGR